MISFGTKPRNGQKQKMTLQKTGGICGDLEHGLKKKKKRKPQKHNRLQ